MTVRLLALDRLVALEPGVAIRGVATFDDAGNLGHHFPRRRLLPASLLLESMAQAVGLAVAHAHHFSLWPILCLVDGFRMEEPEVPAGLVAEIAGEIVSTGGDDSLGRARIEAGGRPVATVERLIYSHFRPVDPGELRELFERAVPGVAPAGPGAEAGR